MCGEAKYFLGSIVELVSEGVATLCLGLYRHHKGISIEMEEVPVLGGPDVHRKIYLSGRSYFQLHVGIALPDGSDDDLKRMHFLVACEVGVVPASLMPETSPCLRVGLSSASQYCSRLQPRS